MQTRNSNIEILRIISMAMVLMVHFVGGAFGLPSLKEMQNPSTNMLIKISFESLSIIGVNCFVLISGFFGIKFSIKGLIKYTLICLFASLFVFFSRTIIQDNFDWNILLNAILIYSHTDLWFVPAYLTLFILSPLLNHGLKNLNNRDLTITIACLTFVNVYLGWYQKGTINPNGYNIMQLIYLYAIGQTLFRFKNILSKISPTKWTLLYITFTILIATSTFYLNTKQSFAYNSPWVLLSSISFFMAFACKETYNNRTINSIASASFMVYLLHKSPYFWLKLKNALLGYAAEYDGITFVAICILLFIAIYTLSTIIGIIYGKISKEAEQLFRFYSRQ